MECKRCGSFGEWGECPQCGRDLEYLLGCFDPDYVFPIICPEVGPLGYEVDLLEDLIETLRGSHICLLRDPKQIGLWLFHNVAVVELDGEIFRRYLEFRDRIGAQVVFQCAEFPFECPIPGCVSVWIAEEDLALAAVCGLPVIELYTIDRDGVHAA